jgi:hypothetical protein
LRKQGKKQANKIETTNGPNEDFLSDKFHQKNVGKTPEMNR